MLVFFHKLFLEFTSFGNPVQCHLHINRFPTHHHSPFIGLLDEHQIYVMSRMTISLSCNNSFTHSRGERMLRLYLPNVIWTFSCKHPLIFNTASYSFPIAAYNVSSFVSTSCIASDVFKKELRCLSISTRFLGSIVSFSISNFSPITINFSREASNSFFCSNNSFSFLWIDS